MKGYVTLACWACDASWTVQRRRGQYPRRCPDCQAGERHARAALRAVCRRLDALVHFHPRLRRWVCEVRTPWHEHPVHLNDEVDARFLLAELGHA